jgi:hypothetical protein
LAPDYIIFITFGRSLDRRKANMSGLRGHRS